MKQKHPTASPEGNATRAGAPPSSTDAPPNPADLADTPLSGPVCVRVDWTLHEADQHPEIQDAFVGDSASFWVRGYTGPTSRTPAETTPPILWEPLTRPFGNAVYPLSTATVTSYYATLAQPQSGVVTAESVSDPDPTVPVVDPPDYGVAYVVAHDVALEVPPLDANTLPYAGLFKVRVWKAPTAVLSARTGDGSSAAFDRYFQTPLSVKIADSTGTTQGTHGMAVRFDIIGDATFDQAGSNQRFATIGPTSAQVFSEYGTAYAPRIKAGSKVGTIQVRASSRFAAQQFHFILHVVDPQGPADAAYVATHEGDYQDQLAGSKFATPLQAKVDNKLKNPAATGNIVFTVYPVADGQSIAASFDSGETTSVSISVPVDEGYATATPLNALSGTVSLSGYVTNLVCAYADTYDTQNNDPRTDDTGQVARFTERVWSGKIASVVRDDGKNGQTTAPGQFFANRLTGTVLDGAWKQPQPVDRIRVAFALQGPGQFDGNDDVPVEQWAPDHVVVLTDAHGVATAPRIQALRGQGGSIVVTLSCPVSNSTPAYTIASVIPPDEGVSVGLRSGDLQDQVVHVAFANPMTVAVKNAKGENATSGQVTFTCRATNDATGSFNGAASANAPVADGSAIAPATLQGDDVVQKTASYGYFEIAAATDHTTQPYVFRQRVWRSKHAILKAVSGATNNRTKPGEFFPLPLILHVVGPDNEDIEDLLVTFTLQGPAEFVYELRPEQTGDTSTSATVRTDGVGLANAPRIKAGADNGPVVVTANATVAQDALPFNLTVLPPSTAAFSVYADPATDCQDTMAGGTYAAPLSVSVKNTAGADATTGTVTFKIYNSAALGGFANETDGTQCVVPVDNGRATATDLKAATNSATGSFSVVAYPTSTFFGDPPTDTSDQTAHFTERVWDKQYVALAKTAGDDQHTTTNQSFPGHLAVKATDTHNNNAFVPEYLVTFVIASPELAAFDLSDPDVMIVSGDNHTVIVRGNENGDAIAPRIVANASTGVVQVQACGKADPGTDFKLTIDSGALPRIYTLEPTPAADVVADPDDMDFTQFLLKKNGAAAPAGVDVTLTITPAGLASFKMNDPGVLSVLAKTDDRGQVAHAIWTGDNAGTATVTATQPQSADGVQRIIIGAGSASARGAKA
ncbi:hypothetical protein CAL29_01045 [Bordetella genomosp. 10]|uniref:Uncharacterized protein n=1 Tax=Bordetella genomosp. 10 TaxID=1416804 RepID=A0A261SIT1_9BORD|nr:hypothetical protein [Bordetella genomosp. 10]OZI37055.1 hypothetical protein CAL29_01045 [Bordetella genomosp. 10]